MKIAFIVKFDAEVKSNAFFTKQLFLFYISFLKELYILSKTNLIFEQFYINLLQNTHIIYILLIYSCFLSFKMEASFPFYFQFSLNLHMYSVKVPDLN